MWQTRRSMGELGAETPTGDICRQYWRQVSPGPPKSGPRSFAIGAVWRFQKAPRSRSSYPTSSMNVFLKILSEVLLSSKFDLSIGRAEQPREFVTKPCGQISVVARKAPAGSGNRSALAESSSVPCEDHWCGRNPGRNFRTASLFDELAGEIELATFVASTGDKCRQSEIPPKRKVCPKFLENFVEAFHGILSGRTDFQRPATPGASCASRAVRSIFSLAAL